MRENFKTSRQMEKQIYIQSENDRQITVREAGRHLKGQRQTDKLSNRMTGLQTKDKNTVS